MIRVPLREEVQTEDGRGTGAEPSSPVSRLYLSPASGGGRSC